MELPSTKLGEIANNTRPIIEDHLLSVMDDSTHEELLSQLLERNKNQFKIAFTFSAGYRGMFNVTNSKKKFSPKQILMKMVFYKLLYHQVLTKSKV